jgi:hypothetical protein
MKNNLYRIKKYKPHSILKFNKIFMQKSIEAKEATAQEESLDKGFKAGHNEKDGTTIDAEFKETT